MTINMEDIKKRLDQQEEKIARLEKIILSDDNVSSKRHRKEISVKEYLRTLSIKSLVHKLLSLGYYLERYKKLESFNSDDLKKAFVSAKEPLPSNINAFINQNIKNGHIMEVSEKKDKKKAFVLTNTGEEFVENEMSNK